MKKDVFTIISKNSIDKNARVNTAFSHYHGISETVMQFPKADIPRENLLIHPINEEDGYDLTSIHCLTALFHRFIIVRNLFILKFSLFKELSMDQQRSLSKPSLKSIDGWRR